MNGLAELAILRAISSFADQCGREAIETAMTVSGIPEQDWTPLCDHLNVIEDDGLIRQNVTDYGFRFYCLTERGKKLLNGPQLSADQQKSREPRRFGPRP
jgi:hypothetical protein